MKMLLSRIRTKLLCIPYVNRWVILFIDSIASAFASFITYTFIYFFIGYLIPDSAFTNATLLSGIISCCIFLIFGTYKNILRHTRMQEILRLFLAILTKCIILATILILLKNELRINVGRFHIIITEIADIMFSLFLLASLRIISICFYGQFCKISPTFKRENVVIYNDDNESTSLSEMIMANKNSNLKVAGYIKMSNNIKWLKLTGVPIFYIKNFTNFKKVVEKNKIKRIIFPSQQSALAEKDRLIAFCIEQHVKVMLLPQISEIANKQEITSQIREIRIEDLLGRDEIKINMEEVQQFVNNKVVMITGGAGSIGSELVRLISEFNIKQLIVLDNAETPLHNILLDLQDKEKQRKTFSEESFNKKYKFLISDVRSSYRINKIFEHYKPEIIFHAAAYKHVPMMETNPSEAIHVNIYGTKNIADAAVKYGTKKMIMVSTDKAVNPTNIMGCSKRIAEIYIQSLSKAIINGDVIGNTQFITTRFGNVLGSNGSVIPRFREQIMQGGPVTVTHKDIIRYFMTIPEACRLVLEAATMGLGYEIFVFDMGKPVKIADLAKNMISLSGFIPDKDIKILYTGLRPGEKLYEELLSNAESCIRTSNKKISIAKVREYDYALIQEQLDILFEKAKSMDNLETVKQMKVIVPEFKSQNSEYCTLDNTGNNDSSKRDSSISMAC